MLPRRGGRVRGTLGYKRLRRPATFTHNGRMVFSFFFDPKALYKPRGLIGLLSCFC